MKTFSYTFRRSVFGLVLALGLVVGMSFPVSSFAATLSRQLDFGMSGADVSSLQTFLASDPSLYPQGLVTGYFGSLTRTAVMNFQSRNGIATVGRVGPQTLAVLNAQMNGNTVGMHETAPIITSSSVSTGNNSATVSWMTDEGASGLVYYSTSPISLREGSETTDVSISGTSVLSNINLSTNHTAVLASLSSNTTYNYVIYTRDSSGNVTVTVPATFRTAN